MVGGKLGDNVGWVIGANGTAVKGKGHIRFTKLLLFRIWILCCQRLSITSFHVAPVRSRACQKDLYEIAAGSVPTRVLLLEVITECLIVFAASAKARKVAHREPASQVAFLFAFPKDSQLQISGKTVKRLWPKNC